MEFATFIAKLAIIYTDSVTDGKKTKLRFYCESLISVSHGIIMKRPRVLY